MVLKDLLDAGLLRTFNLQSAIKQSTKKLGTSVYIDLDSAFQKRWDSEVTSAEFKV